MHFLIKLFQIKQLGNKSVWIGNGHYSVLEVETILGVDNKAGWVGKKYSN